FCVAYVNPAAESLFSASAAHLEGAKIADFFANPVRTRKALERMKNANQAFTQRQAELKLPDDRSMTADFTVTPVQDSDQSYLLIELLPMDRLVQINREEALLSAHSTSRNLIRGLAHEIKNPLGGIRGAAQLLALESDADSDITEYTDVITSEVNRLCNLVDRLLGPNKPPTMDWLNIHEITEHVAALLSAESGDTLTIIRDYDPSLPDIKGDSEQLIQAVLNVSRNALQAMTASGVEQPTLWFQTRVQRNFTIGRITHRIVCKLDILDNGPGVPDDIVDRIFFPMISGRSDGTGLGLPIAQSTINLHDGLIKYLRQDDKTCFSIYLPLEADSYGD
ncbi:MAG: nitrogen regulation protein NR(II), partial [bacterium]